MHKKIIEVTVKVDNVINIDGDVTINEDEIEIWGVIEVGPLSASQYLSINGDGATVTANLLVASAATSLNEDSAKASASNGEQSYAVALENRTLSVSNTAFYGAGGTSFSIGENGLNVSVNLLNDDLTIVSISDKDDAASLLIGGVAGGSVSVVKKIFSGW